MRIVDLFNHASIVTVATNPHSHLRDLVNSHDFEPVSPIVLQNEFEIGNYSRSFEAILNYEACKYGCASLETFLNINHEPISNKSLNWALIRSYYAAFFAAHACLKTTGLLVSRLDKSLVTIIQNDVGKMHSGSLKPFASTYIIKYDQAALQLTFSQTDSNGGYHETFWPVFLEFLNSGFASPLSTQTAYQEEIVLLSTIRDNLLGSGNQAWLSEIRNIINYQLPSELWYPYSTKLRAPFYDEILKGLSVKKSSLADYSKLGSKQVYSKFIATCDAIIELMINLVTAFFAQTQIRNNQYAQVFKRLIEIYNNEKYAA